MFAALITVLVLLVLLMAAGSCRAECSERENSTMKILTCDKLQSMDFRAVYNVSDPGRYSGISISHSGFITNASKVWRDFKNLQELNITHSNLKTIPNDIFSLANKISNLNLGYNDIDNISSRDETFTYAKKLVSLNLECNRISGWINETFKELTALDNLLLSQNEIRRIEKPLFDNMANLKVLLLDNNGIVGISDNSLENLKKLRELFLHNNNLTKITANTFYGLRELRLLHLSDNQILTINSNAFDSMPYLTSIYLTNNQVHFIDSQLFNGKSYTAGIWLNHNKIQNLPANIFKSLGNLEFLHLGYNNISHVEEHTFRGMVKVKTLFMDHNAIDYVHQNAFHYLLNVRYLDFSHNRISEVSSLMLKKLDNVHYMKFDRNSIEKFEDLPALKNLLILDLSFNNVDTFFSFKDCTQLSDLNLQHNNISDIAIDNTRLKQINKIDLTGNPISVQSIEMLKSSPYSYIFQMENETEIDARRSRDKCVCQQEAAPAAEVVCQKSSDEKRESLMNDSFVANEGDADLTPAQKELHGSLLKICLMTVAAVVLVAATLVAFQWRMMRRQTRRTNVAQNQEDILKIMYCKNESE